MQKLSLLIIVAILAITAPILARQINEITRFTYNHLAVDFDEYQGSIVGYEDRVFITSYGRLQELQKQPNGELTQIASFESGYFDECAPVIDLEEEALYCAYYKGLFYDRMFYIVKYDLSTTPITQIATTIPTYINDGITFEIRLLMWGDYLLTVSTDNFGNYVILRLNKRTFQFEDPILTNISGADHPHIQRHFIKDNYFFVQSHTPPILDWNIYIYDLSLDQPFAESVQIIEYNEGLADMYVIDNKLYLLTDSIRIYDVTDMDNISLTFAITPEYDNTFPYFEALLYNDTHLIAFRGQGYPYYHQELHIFDISDTENPVMVHDEIINYGGTGRPLYIADDKLYVSAKRYIGIYDLTANFAKTMFGRDRNDYRIVDEYVVINPRYSNEVQIYSLLEENPNVITITKEDLTSDVYNIRYFQIVNNRLFALTHEDVGWFVNVNSKLDVYDIGDGTAQLIGSVAMGDNSYPDRLKVTGEYIVISGSNVGNRVYQYTENGDFMLISEFSGMVERSAGYTPQQYLLNYVSNGQVEFRDISNPHIVLDTATFPLVNSSGAFYRINENIVCKYRLPGHTFYSFDEAHMFTATYNTSTYRNLEVYNEIAAFVDPSDDTTIHFFDIHDGIPRALAQEDFGYVAPIIKVFTNENKMVLHSRAGIHVYDIEYTVSESDVVTVPAEATLHSNYPNPFNPSTTISFSLACSGAVSIDVYNVRGQRVRSLVSGVYEAGEHSVVWNGVSDDGVRVGSGVYFYRMVSGGYVSVRKMLLLK